MNRRNCITKILTVIITIGALFTIPISAKAEESISDGNTYLILPKLAEKSAVETASWSKESGGNVQLYEYRGQETAQWIFEACGNDTFYIRNSYSGMYLDVKGAIAASKTNVQQYKKNGSEAQQWKLISEKDGYYKIISMCGNYSLDISGAKSANGTNVQIYSENGSDAQRFKLVRVKNAGLHSSKIIYYISPSHSPSSIVEVAGYNKDKGGNIQIWQNKGQDSGKWIIEVDIEGYCHFKNVYSNKYMDVSGANKNSGTNVQQWNGNSNDAQKWEIVSSGNNCYYIVSKCGGNYLDVSGSKNANGTNVLVYKFHGGSNQQFIFTNTDINSTLAIANIKKPSTIDEGSTFSIQGTITSNYTITNVTGGIYSQDGKAVYEYSINPNDNKYELLNGKIDYALYFNKLKSGKYIYRITAKDSSGFEKVLINEYFEVKAKTSSSITYVSQKENKNGNWNGYEKYMGEGCAVASSSMALSSIGITANPKDICKINQKINAPVYMQWQKVASAYKCSVLMRPKEISKEKEASEFKTLEKYLKNFQNNPTKYAPPIIQIPGTNGQPTHYIVVTGKNSEGKYKILDPVDKNNTVLKKKYNGILFQYYKK